MVYMCHAEMQRVGTAALFLFGVTTLATVPPRILDKESSTDMVVRESSNVSMHCKAQGYPEPYVMWRREDGRDINYNGETVNVVDGESLVITRVSRLHMGAYLCIASNGVPPSVSKRVLLRVQFPPMLSIANQLEGAYVGQDVTLECHTEAFPSSINYWTTTRGDMIVSGIYLTGEKYEAWTTDQGYSRQMRLRIRNVTDRDFGSYQCVAKNSLGETDGVIKLEEIPAPVTKTSNSLSVNTSSGFVKGRSRMKQERYSKNEVEEYPWQDIDYTDDYTFSTPALPEMSASSNSRPCLLLVMSAIMFFC